MDPDDRLDERRQAVRDSVYRWLRLAHRRLRPAADAALETASSELARDPDRTARLTAIGLSVAVLHVLVRYLPEYLRLLGAGPIVIGFVGSVGLSAPVLYRSSAFDRGAAFLDRVESLPRSSAFGLLGSLGLVLWLLASYASVGPALSGWAWAGIAVGVLAVGSWLSFGLGSTHLTGTLRLTCERRSDCNREVDLHIQGVTAAGFALSAVFLTLFREPRAGLLAILAIAIPIGLSAVLFQYFARNAARDDQTTEGSALGAGAVRSLPVSRSLPASVGHFLLGETLVRFARGMVSVFVVVFVIDTVGVEATLLGRRFRPDAFFGLLVAIESAAGLLSTGVARRLTERDGRSLVAVDFLESSLLPLALLIMPADPLAAACVFALSGLRLVGRPARRTATATALERSLGETPMGESAAAGERGGAVPRGAIERYRVVRDVVTIPSALLGGVLYAVSPSLAFGLATVVGASGVCEFGRFVRRTR